MSSVIRQPPVRAFEILDFSGGWNCADAASQVKPNESPDCMNVTLAEHGGLVMRLGLQRVNGSALAGVLTNLYYSKVLALYFFQVGATLYRTTDFGSASSVATLSTGGRLAFVDFLNKMVAVHPVDGVFTYDGTTWTNTTATVKGTCAAVWQNKVFVGDSKRLWWSEPSNVAFGFDTVNDFNDIREVDDEAITALGVGQGMDSEGRPGLLLWKADSFYRVNSATTGQYTTLDVKAGAAGPLAVTSLFGKVAFVNRHGIFATDGINPPELVSANIDPLFTEEQVNLSALGGAAAGVYRDRMAFSIPFGEGQATNNLTLEYHPLDGWITPHDFGFACATSTPTGKLYTASPTAAYVRETFKGGNDESVPITARYQTAWFVIENNYYCQMQRARVGGSGSPDLFVRADYTLGQGDLYAAELFGDAFAWNEFTWNDGSLWGPLVYEQYQDFWALGPARAVSFVFEETSSSVASGPNLLRDGAAPEIGAFSIYSIVIDYVRLGLA